MYYFSIVFLVFLDQLTKYLISSRMYVGQSVEIAPFFHLSYVTNTGIAFSLFQQGNVIFIIVTALALIAMAVWHQRSTEPRCSWLSCALMLVFSGASGNLIDRVFRGAVVDFLDVSAGTYHWPAFNVADSCISIGGILLMVMLLRNDAHVSRSR
ncbi:MAG: signal peptidase II [Elusimicrobia bacterium]|nr:signal peptidase II [Elusimicrobiota bacterium]